MRLTPRELRRMVEGASTPEERIEGPFDPVESAGTGGERLRRWRERVAGGDARRFRRRLRGEGWSEAEARRALGPVRLRAGASLPGWASIVAEAAALSAEAGEPLLAPFVQVARRRLAEAGPRPPGYPVSAPALAQMEAALLRALAAECAPALEVERSAFAAVRPGGGDFEEHMRSGGLTRLLVRLPVLARLAATRVEHWLAATAELLERLRVDQQLLRDTFAGSRPLGPVRSAALGLSDPHGGGRTVAVLEFASGDRVVYKPRGMAVDAACQELLRWLRRDGTLPRLRTLTVLDRGTYGWMEHAAPAPCRDAAEVALHHERAGVLSCLAYLLGGTDFHAGNLLACGGHPVLVDLEALLTAPVREGLPGGGTAEEAAECRDSVLGTSLFPRWGTGPDGQARREGGLVAAGPEPTNLPWLGGRPCPAVEHLDRTEAGFARAYRALLRHREDLLSADGPLRAFSAVEVRVVLRATRSYQALLLRTRHPRFLADGAERSLELDTLARSALRRSGRGSPWRVLRAERRELEEGDVPLFRVPADGTRGTDGSSREVGELRGRSGYAEMVRRLGSLGPADLRVQRRLVRLAFTVRAPRLPREPREEAGPLPAAELREEAAAIAEDLLRSALRAPGGGATWLQAVRTGTSHRSGFAEAGLSFAHGLPGIALFLAACARATGERRYGDAARDALRPLLRSLRARRYSPALAARMGIGGAAGSGGIVYALVRTARFLDDDAVLRAAGEVASGITPGRVRRDRALDLFGGSAGAALGLLALHEASGKPDALERAAGCGTHLLNHLRSPSAPAASRPGFAHGAAGVAHALHRLHGATGDADFLRAAEEPGRGRLTGPRGPLRFSWCRGAAGVGLASGGRRMAAALAAVERAPLAACDHPCCGNLGAVELLLVAWQRTGRGELREKALERAGEVVRRSRRRCSYGTGVADLYAPGFLQGTAGIGYGLLRLADPGLFPCALLWE